METAFPETETTVANGVSLAYRETGMGDPVILIHGGFSDTRTWTNQTDVLGREFRTIAYSRRYARPNAGIADDADDQMQPHVEDLAAFVKDRGAAPAHLLGHSWGGFIALMLAIQRPQLVRSLILVEPPVLSLFVDLPPRPAQLARLLLSHPRTALAIVKLGAFAMAPAEKAFRRGDDAAAIEAFGRGVLGKARFRNLSPERYGQVWDNRAPDRAQMLGAGFPPLSDEQVSAVVVPALLVSGSESPAVFHRLNEHLLKLLPNATLVVIDNASHNVHEDAPAEFNRAVLDFLRAH